MRKNKKRVSQKLKKQAYNMHKKGLTTREIADYLPRSHAWVASAIKELSPEIEKDA